MNKTKTLGVVMATVCSMVLGAAALSYAVATDEGAQIFQEVCSACHSAKVRPLDNLHMSGDQWKDTVERMIDQGAEVPKGKKDVLLDYLAATHGVTSAPTATVNK